MISVNKIKVLYLFIFVFIFCLSIGHSQDIPNYSVKYSTIETHIRFFNKQIYYIGNPIVIEFQIINNGIDPFLFITSYNKIFTFDFTISSFENRSVEHSKHYIIRRRQFEPVLNDEITLKQNEVYGVRIDIGEWFDFQEPGEYIIKGLFFPNLITDEEKLIYSENELYLTINPPYTEVVKEKERIEEIKKLKAESLPPYEVVDFLLNALTQKDFEKYFLYIKMNKFIEQFDNAKNEYFAARDKDKPRAIEKFKNYLKGLNKLESVPFSETIPTDFEIEKTIIEKKDAEVIVTEIFEYGLVTEKKRYTYYLHLYGDKWLLENYTVVNIQ
jgi:hypothetical protein